MNDPYVIRLPNDHFHVRLDGVIHRNLSRAEARSLLWVADLDENTLLKEAVVQSTRVIECLEYRKIGRHRWWVDGKPFPEKVVRYILRDECGCTKEQCDLIIYAHKLSDHCRQLRERIEGEAISELYRNCREWLLSRKSGSAPRKPMSAESQKPYSQSTNSVVSTPRARRQSRTRSK